MRFTFAAALLLASSAQARNLKQIALAQVNEPAANGREVPVPDVAIDASPVIGEDGQLDLPGSESYRKASYKTMAKSIYDDDEDDYLMPPKKSCGCSLPNIDCPVVPQA
jgi:hypothetical protein